jgi:hypothetical protein
MNAPDDAAHDGDARDGHISFISHSRWIEIVRDKAPSPWDRWPLDARM